MNNKQNKLCVAYLDFNEDKEIKEDVIKYLLDKSDFLILHRFIPYRYYLGKISNKLLPYIEIFKNTELKYKLNNNKSLMPFFKRLYKGLLSEEELNKKIKKIDSNIYDSLNIIKKFYKKSKDTYLDTAYIVKVDDKLKKFILNKKIMQDLLDIEFLTDKEVIASYDVVEESVAIPTNLEEVDSMKEKFLNPEYLTLDHKLTEREIMLNKPCILEIESNSVDATLKNIILNNTTHILIKFNDKEHQIKKLEVDEDIIENFKKIDIQKLETIEFFDEDKFYGRYSKESKSIILNTTIETKILIEKNNKIIK